MKRLTILLPEDVYEQLRRDAFRAKSSMADLIRKRLQGSVEGPRRRRKTVDPILRVAGICRGHAFSNDIDDALYER